MIRAARIWIATALIILAAPAALSEEPGQLFGFALGDSAPDPDNLAGLKNAFGPEIAKTLKGLAFVDRPAPHYLLDLGNERMLGVWFDGGKDDRPIFWLDLRMPAPIDGGSLPPGEPDVDIRSAHLRAQVRIDPMLRPDHRAAIKAHVTDRLEHRQIETLPTNDMAFRLELLGEDFRGRLLSFHDGRSDGDRRIMEAELFDATIAPTEGE